MPDNPSNEPDLILDKCIQRLLKMKDNNCLDMSDIQSVVNAMMNELKENRRRNIDPLMELIDSDDDIYAEKLSDDDLSSINSSNFTFLQKY